MASEPAVRRRGGRGRRRWARRTLLAGLLAMLAQASPAEPIQEVRDLVGIGRVNVAGQGFCTGTLVAPHWVVTAAHCLFHPLTGRPAPLGDIHFVAGWDRGDYVAHAQPVRVHLHPDYDWAARQRQSGLELDVAVLEFRAPVAAPTLPVAEGAPTPASVAVVHYSQRRPHLAALSRACRFTGWLGVLWRLDCPVEPGASGAPVLVVEGGELQVAAIVIGRTESAARVGSLVLPLAGRLPRVPD